MCHIESSHFANGTFTIDDILEKVLLADATAGDDAEACDYDAVLGSREGCGGACGGWGVGAEGEGGDACGCAEEEV